MGGCLWGKEDELTKNASSPDNPKVFLDIAIGKKDP
jgi:hypothetical protein